MLLVWLIGSPVRAQVVVLNTQVTEPAVSVNGLRAIFSMRRRVWSDGQPVTVFVLPDRHPLHRAFTKQVLGVYPHRLREVWDKQVFTGTGQAPVEVADEAEMRRRVAATPGAIGYLTDEKQAQGVVRVLEME